MALLELKGVSSGYGHVQVIRSIDLEVKPGTVLAIVGPNGAGKSTLLKTIAGLLPFQGGAVRLAGQPLRSGHPVEASRCGVILVPDDRSLFGSLTVLENIKVAQRPGAPGVTEMLEIFPALEKRLQLPARLLSGGEQQMLAVARGLVQHPRVLLIDEMSMGLAPVIAEDLLSRVKQMARSLDTSVVLVEQHVGLALEVADQGVVISRGEVVLHGMASELAVDISRIESAYLADAQVSGPR